LAQGLNGRLKNRRGRHGKNGGKPDEPTHILVLSDMSGWS